MDSQQQRADTVRTSPQAGALHSSRALGWREIVVEQFYSPAGEITCPPSPSHLISVPVGAPIPVEHVHDKRTVTNMWGRGSVQIIPAGTENIWRHGDGVQLIHLHLAPELLQQMATDDGQRHVEFLSHFQPQDRRIESISSALLTEVLEGGATGRLYVEGLATALAAHLLHTYSTPPRPLPQNGKQLPAFLFRRITTLIEERLAEDLSLAELASAVGLSSSHFSSLFRNTTGLSPHRYLVRRRLERAQNLLTSTRRPIGEIATMVGSYDQSHLVRHMRRMNGVTPTYIRDHLS
jgi:AraC family transcriptional regulator